MGPVSQNRHRVNYVPLLRCPFLHELYRLTRKEKMHRLLFLSFFLKPSVPASFVYNHLPVGIVLDIPLLLLRLSVEQKHTSLQKCRISVGKVRAGGASASFLPGRLKREGVAYAA